MGKNETVLCINREKLPVSWVQQISIVPMDMNSFVRVCTATGFEFILRTDAETDDSKKQIIPYILLQTNDLEYTAVYNRQGSEKRLHDLWSIGIGGHINPIDTSDTGNDFTQILAAGMSRELNEELKSFPKEDAPQFLGIISEEETAVGQVHLGAVFRILTEQPQQYEPGEELYKFHWIKTHQLSELTLELWSDLALKLLH